MELIAITPPEILENEVRRIVQLLDGGKISRIHIRHPRVDERIIRKLLESIPPMYYPRLSLHDSHHLAAEYCLGGVHLNGRNPMVPGDFTGLVSRSCHSAGEVYDSEGLDYVFLSPVFDSISKPGYQSAFAPAELRNILAQARVRVYALGGVTPERLPELESLGFYGAAMLGAAWR